MGDLGRDEQHKPLSTSRPQTLRCEQPLPPGGGQGPGRWRCAEAGRGGDAATPRTPDPVTVRQPAADMQSPAVLVTSR